MRYEIESDEPVTMAVVKAVSDAEGREPCSIPPLFEVVDTDALDTLFASLTDGTPRVGGRVSFVYGDSWVTVENAEFVTVEPCQGPAPGHERPPAE